MEMSLLKRFDSGPLAMLVGLGALACCLLAGLAFADASYAEAPAKGLACVEANGKISGRGSTFQNNEQEEMAKFYRNDVCGPTASKQRKTSRGRRTGRSRQHDARLQLRRSRKSERHGVRCGPESRELPHGRLRRHGQTVQQPTAGKELNEAPEKLVTGEGKTCAATTTFKFPFQPNEPPKEWPDREAGHEDTTAPLMSFPIGGSARRSRCT